MTRRLVGSALALIVAWMAVAADVAQSGAFQALG